MSIDSEVGCSEVPVTANRSNYVIFKRYEIFLSVSKFTSRISSCSTEERCTRLGWIKTTTLFSKVAFKTISMIKTELNKDKTPGKIAITSTDIPPSGSFYEVLTTTRSPSTSQTRYFLKLTCMVSLFPNPSTIPERKHTQHSPFLRQNRSN